MLVDLSKISFFILLFARIKVQDAYLLCHYWHWKVVDILIIDWTLKFNLWIIDFPPSCALPLRA